MKRNQPKTSLEAWRSVKDTSMLSEHQQLIITALRELKTGISDEIAKHVGIESAKIYRRMSELERLSIIRKTGEQRKTSSGRNSYVYEITPTPKKEEPKEVFVYQPSLF